MVHLYEKNMKKKTTNSTYKTIGIHIRTEEYKQITSAVQESMCSSISEYGRKMLLSEPIIIQYRNRSADDAVEAAIEILKDLRKFLHHPSFTDLEKEWLRAQIVKLEETAEKIFTLCLRK